MFYRGRIFVSGLKNKFLSAFKEEAGWSGSYSSWQEVQRKCSGYDNKEILEKVTKAILTVKEGKAAFERDSVVFEKPDFNKGFCETLQLISDNNNGQINVLDFGGSLGSVFFQYKPIIEKYRSVNWCVVEQEHFVKVGKQKLEDKDLKFYYTMDECLKENKLQTALLSSVISYIEEPYSLLKDIISRRFNYVIIDRTLFIDNEKDLLTKQVVPENIYKASYPCWIFSKSKLLDFMLKDHDLVLEFDPYNNEQIDVNGEKAYFSALVFKRKND